MKEVESVWMSCGTGGRSNKPLKGLVLDDLDDWAQGAMRSLLAVIPCFQSSRRSYKISDLISPQKCSAGGGSIKIASA